LTTRRTPRTLAAVAPAASRVPELPNRPLSVTTPLATVARTDRLVAQAEFQLQPVADGDREGVIADRDDIIDEHRSSLQFSLTASSARWPPLALT
jgi:hypothetical protein